MWVLYIYVYVCVYIFVFWCCVVLCCVLFFCLFYFFELFISLESGCFTDRSFPFLQNSKLQIHTRFGFFLLGVILLLLVDGGFAFYVINCTDGIFLFGTEGKFWVCFWLCICASVYVCVFERINVWICDFLFEQ